jgi:hypothetical protein
MQKGERGATIRKEIREWATLNNCFIYVIRVLIARVLHVRLKKLGYLIFLIFNRVFNISKRKCKIGYFIFLLSDPFSSLNQTYFYLES